MDGAASVIAVVSLALQLVQSVDTIKTFVRDVKGASKELERLAELLDRLSALLQDVRDVMERQTSLQHFPLPSNTIFACLKTCEKSLVLLQDVVKKHDTNHANDVSAVRRLKNDIRLGFKVKDIATFEVRIQRDVNDLHAALGVNLTSIATTVLPIMLSNQNALMAPSSVFCTQNRLKSPRNLVHSDHNMSLQTPPPSRSTKTRQEWIQSPLNWFGIRHRRTVKYMCVTSGQPNEPQQKKDIIISESYESVVSWKLLGYACHWSRQYPYGSILPSLQVRPLVRNIWTYNKFIQDCTIEKIQQEFESGVLHPFSVDMYGESLLHVAAAYKRPDICHLLQGYGLKLEFSSFGESPLLYCLRHYGPIYSELTIVDTLRVIMFEFDQIDGDIGVPGFFVCNDSMESIKWLWINAAFVFHGSELMVLRTRLVEKLVQSYHTFIHGQNEKITQTLVSLIDDEMLGAYKQGNFTMLPQLFWRPFDSRYVSEAEGDTFLQLLARLGLDVDACIQRELCSLPNGILLLPDGLQRRVVFEKFQDGSRSLSWQREYDALEAGYEVVSEFSTLVSEMDVFDSIDEWPFDQFDSYNARVAYFSKETRGERDIRFSRRIANKARKERARTGQKLPRSRMPGAWI